MNELETRADAGQVWLAELLGDAPAAEAALSAYDESCSDVGRAIVGGAPAPEALARWLALASLGSRGMGELIERAMAAEVAGDAPKATALADLSQRLQAASSQLSTQNSK
jgi:hypothetical protein